MALDWVSIDQEGENLMESLSNFSKLYDNPRVPKVVMYGTSMKEIQSTVSRAWIQAEIAQYGPHATLEIIIPNYKKCAGGMFGLARLEDVMLSAALDVKYKLSNPVDLYIWLTWKGSYWVSFIFMLWVFFFMIHIGYILIGLMFLQYVLYRFVCQDRRAADAVYIRITRAKSRIVWNSFVSIKSKAKYYSYAFFTYNYGLNDRRVKRLIKWSIEPTPMNSIERFLSCMLFNEEPGYYLGDILHIVAQGLERQRQSDPESGSFEGFFVSKMLAKAFNHGHHKCTACRIRCICALLLILRHNNKSKKKGFPKKASWGTDAGASATEVYATDAQKKFFRAYFPKIALDAPEQHLGWTLQYSATLDHLGMPGTSFYWNDAANGVQLRLEKSGQEAYQSLLEKSLEGLLECSACTQIKV